MAAATTPGRARRIAHYVGTMFPPAVLVPYGLASFFSIHFALQALAGPGHVVVTWRATGGAVSLVLLLLLMRVYDELKDVENDIRLGRAGDPRYKDRPIVTGAVLIDDVRLLRNGITIVLWLTNIALGWPFPLAAFAVAYGVAWLSSRWFFRPRISQDLLLAFATHNPITLVFWGYVVAVFAADFGARALRPAAIPLVLGFWAPVAAWETSRKIRTPEQETDYQTYSKVLGWRVAPLVPAAFVALSAALLVPVARATGLGWTLPAILLAVAAVVLGACLRFHFAPSPAAAKLQPFAEFYGVVANVGFVVALGAARGVSWLPPTR